MATIAANGKRIYKKNKKGKKWKGNEEKRRLGRLIWAVATNEAGASLWSRRW